MNPMEFAEIHKASAPASAAAAAVVPGATPRPESKLVRVLEPSPLRTARLGVSYRVEAPAKTSRWAGLREGLKQWWRRVVERRELAGLGDRDLRDIGITYAEAQREARKWFWQD